MIETLQTLSKIDPKDIPVLIEILEAAQSNNLEPIVKRLCKENKKLLAVIVIQNLKGISLLEARNYVNSIQ